MWSKIQKYLHTKVERQVLDVEPYVNKRGVLDT